MLKFLLSPEQGFTTHLQNGVPKLNLCEEKNLPKNPSAISSHNYWGKASKVYATITNHYEAHQFTKEKLGEMYYPTIVALRVYAYETVGFKYNRTKMMKYVGWHFYGKEGSDFLDNTWLAYLILKECQEDVKLTVYSSIFYPLLPSYQAICLPHGHYPKYWGKTITEENELDFFDKRYDAFFDYEGKGTRGERMAMDYFKKSGIKYIYNEPVDYVCKYCGQQILRPDFLLPDLDVVVEIHGPQHLEFSKGFHASYDDFVHQQLRDIDMRCFCHEYGYALIEIPFRETENIPVMIARGLRNIKKRKERRQQ